MSKSRVPRLKTEIQDDLKLMKDLDSESKDFKFHSRLYCMYTVLTSRIYGPYIDSCVLYTHMDTYTQTHITYVRTENKDKS